MDLFPHFRSLYLNCKRAFLKNNRITIICNNCLGGFLYHDYKMKFYSPTINLMIHAYDYNRFLYYISNKLPIVDLVDITKDGDECLQGLLNGDVRISFVHYHSFEEAKKKWLERVSRID